MAEKKKKRRGMRLPNGFGGVYMLSGNRRKPWISRKTTGWDENGKQIYYTIGYYANRADALAALTEYNKNPIGDVRDITLGELYAKWNLSKFPKLTESTVRTYTSAWLHLSALEGEKVRDLKTSHYQAIIDQMSNEKKLSRSACNKVKILAGILNKQAMADDIIHKNYAAAIELPNEDSKEQEFFTEEEIKAIEKLAVTNIWAKAIMIMIYTGFRISELCDQSKFRVDLKEMVMVGGGKTDAGRDRVMPIHPKIQDHVHFWYKTPGPHLINREGEKIRTEYFRKYLFRPTLQEAGVRVLNPHATRHTFATLLGRAKTNPKAVQDLLGHEEYSTSLIYTHTELKDLRKAIKRI